MRNNVLCAFAACLLSWQAPAARAIETVDNLDVSKYLGRWYQLYGNEFTSMIITRDSTCIAADYGLDEATGNITVINSDREHVPTGELNTITGYAYGTGEANPGQLKVHLGQVPVDGDYWIAALGPATFGPDGAYEWAIVTGPEAVTLFVLVRDVEKFEKMFADDVLALVDSLGFKGPIKEPQRIVQEGCLPFDPTADRSSQRDGTKARMALRGDVAAFPSSAAAAADVAISERDRKTADSILSFASLDLHVTQTERWSMVTEFVRALAQDTVDWAKTVVGKADSTLCAPVETVDTLDVDRYTGRWYQAYASFTVATLLEQKGACVTADYKVNDDGSIAVTNTARAKSVDGEIVEMKGYAYSMDQTKPGQLMVHLDDVPVDGPYWVLALGDEDGTGPYPWAIVSDPLRAFLFVLVRDPEAFSSGSQEEKDLLQLCKDLGFTSFWNSPRKTVQEGCTYTAAGAFGADAAPPVAVLGTGSSKQAPAEKKVASLFGGGPLHASCKLSWTFAETDCDAVKDKLVAAAKSMSGFGKCNGGNKCGYSVVDLVESEADMESGASLKLVHETSVKHYKDDLTIDLTGEGGSCTAKGFSTSQTWYAVLDNSVNYCNLHNLVEATGLDYKETDVSDKTCTQYSSADCERY